MKNVTTRTILLTVLLYPFSILLGQTINAHQWEVVDIPFTIKKSVEEPLKVNFSAQFIHESGEIMDIPGFYDGDNRWLLRFSPPKTGGWSYKTISDHPKLFGKEGSIVVSPSPKPDEHGPVIIPKDNRTQFAYADGTPYFLLAFEIDWLFALDWDNPDDIPKSKEIIDEIADHGFNQAVMNVYAYDANWGERDKIRPEHNYANPTVFPFGGTNEDPDYSQLNIPFFQHLDRVMAYLDEREVVSHLMIYVWNKNVNWPEASSEADNMYFDYVVKRYQAYPNLIWDISKEALGYGRNDMNYITERIDRLRRLDGHKRLLSVHDYGYCSNFPGKVDFISIQNWRPNLYNTMKEVVARHPRKPVFNIEHGGYEKTMHNIFWGAYSDPLICLDRNYQCVFAGAYSTYYWQNTSWYEVVYNPSDLPKENQPNLSWYKHLADLFNTYDFNQLKPYQKGAATYSLSDGSSVYLFYLTEHMDAITGGVKNLPGNPKGKHFKVKWFDPFTGEYHDGGTNPVSGWLSIKRHEALSGAIGVCILELVP